MKCFALLSIFPQTGTITEQVFDFSCTLMCFVMTAFGFHVPVISLDDEGDEEGGAEGCQAIIISPMFYSSISDDVKMTSKCLITLHTVSSYIGLPRGGQE